MDNFFELQPFIQTPVYGEQDRFLYSSPEISLFNNYRPHKENAGSTRHQMNQEKKSISLQIKNHIQNEKRKAAIEIIEKKRLQNYTNL